MRFLITKTPWYCIEGQMQDGRLFIHLTDIKDWCTSLYRELLLVSQMIKDECFKNKIEEVFVAVPADDTKLVKFQGMFGFEHWKTIYQNEKKVYLMRQYTGDYLNGN